MNRPQLMSRYCTFLNLASLIVAETFLAVSPSSDILRPISLRSSRSSVPQVFSCFFTTNWELGLALIQTALALSGQVQTTDTINTLSASVTTVIDEQASANVKIQRGLMLVNQLIDLVQIQLDVL